MTMLRAMALAKAILAVLIEDSGFEIIGQDAGSEFGSRRELGKQAQRSGILTKI
jgi:hypothetical protein